MRQVLLATVFLAAFSGTAMAAEAETGSRYTLSPTEGGFVRLDTVTGAVSTCTGTVETLVCRSVADDRQALQSEIDRLGSENEALKEEIARLKDQSGTSGGIEVPSEEDVDKAMGFLEKMVRRFKALIKELQEEPAETTPL